MPSIRKQISMLVSAGMLIAPFYSWGKPGLIKFREGVTNIANLESRALSQNRFLVTGPMPGGTRAFFMNEEGGRALYMSQMNAAEASLSQYSFKMPAQNFKGDDIKRISYNSKAWSNERQVVIEREVATGTRADEVWGVNKSMNDIPVAFKSSESVVLRLPGHPPQPTSFIGRGANDPLRTLSVTNMKMGPSQTPMAEQLFLRLGPEIEGGIASWKFDPITHRLQVFVVSKNRPEVTEYTFSVVAKPQATSAEQQSMLVLARNRSSNASLAGVEVQEAKPFGEPKKYELGMAEKLGIFAKSKTYKDVDKRADIADEIPAISHQAPPRPVAEAGAAK